MGSPITAKSRKAEGRGGKGGWEEEARPPSLVHMQHSHCGLRAGLVVNVFPVIAFPLLSFGQSLCVCELFFLPTPNPHPPSLARYEKAYA